MKKNLLKFAALIFTAALFTLTSCKKGDADAQTAEDAARGSYIMADAFALGNSGSNGGTAAKAQFSACSFILGSVEGGFSMTWTDCTDDFGITRNGTINVTGDESVYDNVESASLTIEFVNYTIQGESVTGNITFSVSNDLSGIYMSVTADNFRVTYADGTYVHYNSASISYIFSLMSGFQFEITGSADGINRNGQHFTSETEGMTVDFFDLSGTCAYPTQGIMTVNVDGEKPIILDYNSGTCGEILVTQKRHDDVTITVF